MGFLKNLRNELVEFCDTTSIQGMRNVSDPKQGKFIRILWFFVVILSFTLSGICIKESIDGKARERNVSITHNFFFFVSFQLFYLVLSSLHKGKIINKTSKNHVHNTYFISILSIVIFIWGIRRVAKPVMKTW